MATKAFALVSLTGDVMVTTVSLAKSQAEAIANEHFPERVQIGWSVREVSIQLRGDGPSASASPIEASSPEPSSARTTAESGTARLCEAGTPNPSHPSEEVVERSPERKAQAGRGEGPQWIPVSERLPMDWQSVTVHIQDNDRTYIDVWTFDPHSKSWKNGTVTYWMPLPEPPAPQAARSTNQEP